MQMSYILSFVAILSYGMILSGRDQSWERTAPNQYVALFFSEKCYLALRRKEERVCCLRDCVLLIFINNKLIFVQKTYNKFLMQSYKSALQLNSYKLDNQTYHSKLRQYNLENQSLKSIISNTKNQERNLTAIVQSLQLENEALRGRIKNGFTPNSQQCQNCTYLSKQKNEGGSSNNLKKELLDAKVEAREYREMYDNERQNKKQQTLYYEDKIRQLKMQINKIAQKYQEKMKLMAGKSTHSFQANFNNESNTSIKKHISPQHFKHQSQRQITTKNSFKNTSISSRQSPSHQRLSLAQRRNNSHEQQKDSIVMEANLKKILIPIKQRFDKMKLTLRDLENMPQVEKFIKGGGVPSKNKFIRLFREFPFECEDEDELDQSYNFVMKELEKKRIPNDGPHIFELIVDLMRQF